MLDVPEAPKPDQESPDSLGLKPSRARSLANLRPAWTPETAPRAGGRAPDGGGTKDHPIRALLRRKLAKRRALHRLINSWIDAACDGDAQAREQILKRLDPILEDPAQGRTVLEGLRLELREGKASVTLVRGQGVQALPGPRDAETETSESRGGELTQQASELTIEASPSQEETQKGSQEPSRDSEKALSGLGDGLASPSPSGS